MTAKIDKIRAETFERTLEVRTINAEDRTVELAFSSEFEVQRWYGVEILGHDKGEVRMERLQSATAALLVNHDPGEQVGVVVSAEIDKDGKGRALVRFSKSAHAEEIFQDVKDGIRKLVSVGYRIHEMKLAETREGGVDVYRITDWEPHEISLVSIPADPSVGVGRSTAAGVATEVDRDDHRTETPQEERPRVSVESPRERQQKHEGSTIMPDKEQTFDVAAERKAATDAANQRASTILKMGDEYKATDLASQAVRDGKSVGEFQDMLLKRLNEQTARPLDEQARGGEIGMSDKDVKQFSFMRAIRHLANPSDPALRKAAAFELECSRVAQDAYDKEAKGILVPADVLGRAFSSTTPGSGPGSNIIATELQSASFIELLRNKSFALQRGRKLAGLVGNVDIPRQKSANTTYWVGEGSAPTGGEMGTDKINLSPKTLGAFSDITRKMLLQSSPDAEALTRDDLLAAMALEVDRAAIYGSGSSNQPRGVKLYAGINGVDFVAANPTYAELVAMETAISSDNADVANMAYVGNAAFRGYCKTTLKSAGVSGYLWEPGNTINGYECAITNQCITGDVFFGNWNELLIAMWSGIDLTVDPYALATSGGVRVIAFQDVDFNLRHVDSFCWGSILVA